MRKRRNYAASDWAGAIHTYHRRREAQEEAAAKRDIERLQAEEQAKREAELAKKQERKGA